MIYTFLLVYYSYLITLYGFCNNSVILVNNSVIDSTEIAWYSCTVRSGHRTLTVSHPFPPDRLPTARAATPAHSTATAGGIGVYIRIAHATRRCKA